MLFGDTMEENAYQGTRYLVREIDNDATPEALLKSYLGE